MRPRSQTTVPPKKEKRKETKGPGFHSQHHAYTKRASVGTGKHMQMKNV
jgi:hypothetical protein